MDNEKDTDTLWLCELCGYEWLEANPKVLYIKCPKCKSPHIQIY